MWIVLGWGRFLKKFSEQNIFYSHKPTPPPHDLKNPQPYFPDFEDIKRSRSRSRSRSESCSTAHCMNDPYDPNSRDTETSPIQSDELTFKEKWQQKLKYEQLSGAYIVESEEDSLKMLRFHVSMIPDEYFYEVERKCRENDLDCPISTCF